MLKSAVYGFADQVEARGCVALTHSPLVLPTLTNNLGALSGLARNVLLARTTASRGFVNIDEVGTSAQRNADPLILSLLMFALWWCQVLD